MLRVPGALTFGRAFTAEPTAFMTQIFKIEFVLTASLPSNARSDVNRVFMPAGEHAGLSLERPPP
jgi:hypothetical protein